MRPLTHIHTSNNLESYVTNQIACLAILAAAAAKSLQSCLTLCDPIDGSPPGSPVPGILQARTLEWVAMPSSRGSSQPRDQTQISHIAVDSLPSESPGKPTQNLIKSGWARGFTGKIPFNPHSNPT